MAKENKTSANLLTTEQRTRLEGLAGDIEQSEKRIVLLKKLGLGVGDIEEKLQWAKKRRRILLDEG